MRKGTAMSFEAYARIRVTIGKDRRIYLVVEPNPHVQKVRR